MVPGHSRGLWFLLALFFRFANDFAGELVVTDRVGAAQEPTFQYREGPARLDGDVPRHCGESSKSPKQRTTKG